MKSGADERGQSVLVGSILVFALLIVSFSTYQAVVVPGQNAEVEFDHSQRVEGQFSEFRGNVVNAVESGTERSTTFSLGPQYPVRTLALNPPPPAGRLSTSEAGTVEIDGAEVCRTGDAPVSRSLVFEPGYNEYETAEAVVYEYGVVAATFRDGGTIVRSQTHGTDGEFDLTLLTGEVSASRVGSVGVDVEASHRYAETVDAPTVTLPSRFDAATWETEILANRSDVASVTDAGDGRVEIAFADPVEISCAVAGLNGEPAFEPPTEPDGTGGSGASGFGQGGEERWDSDNATRTVSTQGGVWRGIGEVNAVVLSEPRLSPRDGSLQDTRSFRLVATVGDPPGEGQRYVFVVPEPTTGMTFRWNDAEGRFDIAGNAPAVTIIEEDNTGTAGPERVIDGAGLDPAAVDRWYLDGDPLNLLDPVVYDGLGGGEETELRRIRNHLEGNTGQEAFVTDVTGRANLTIDQRELAAAETGAPAGQTLQPTGISNDGNQLAFGMEHTGSEELTIEGFAVDATAIDGSITIDDGNAAELEIRDTGDQDGIANRNGNPGSFDADGTQYDLVEDSNQGNEGADAVIAGGQEGVTVDFRFFDPELGALEFAGEDTAEVTVTFVLDSGEEQQFYFRQSG